MIKYFFQAMEGKLIGGRYRLISLLGEGGIGFVARAEQVSVGREVAIKFLSRSADDREQVVRFKREAKALAMLRHPACLTLHDFDYSAELECYYMVTELVDGAEFGAAVHAGMPLSEALLIMSHVCDALAYAHEQGILHRDLKPQNVMVTGSHALPVKLLDFGLARLYQSTFGEDDYKVSRTGHVYGTPAYMSPEQCMASEDIGPSSDVYSLGVMLYELCSGRLPFEKGTMTQVLMSHITEDIEPLNEPHLPQDLLDLVTAMLEKEPEDRPQDLYEVRSTLEDVAFRLMDQPSFPSSKTPLPVLEALYRTPTPTEFEGQSFFTAPADHPTFEGAPSDISASHTSLEIESEAILLVDEVTPTRPRTMAMAFAAVLLISLSAIGLGFAMAPEDATRSRGEVTVRTLQPTPSVGSPVREVESVHPPKVEAPDRTQERPEAPSVDETAGGTAAKRDVIRREPNDAKPAAKSVAAKSITVTVAEGATPEVVDSKKPAGASSIQPKEPETTKRAKTLSFN